MSYEIEEQFIARITAPLRLINANPPLTLGPYAASLLHGTTIGAFKIEDGRKAIAFSDGKVSLGNTPAHLAYRKILTIDHHTRMLMAGSPVVGVAHAAAMKSWIGFREDTSGEFLSARAKVRFLSRLLLGGINLMHAGIICSPILVTFDVRHKKIARIWSLGAEGSEIEHDVCTVGGSGSSVNVLLKDAWRPGMTVRQGIRMARKLISHIAPDNDSFSGGKVSIDIVGPDGAQTIE